MGLPMVDAQVKEMLARNGLPLSSVKEARLEAHARLLREWNAFAGLVSSREVERLGDHYADALSLGPVVRHLGQEAGHLLDIGTGGGFPALPLKVLFPEMRVTLVERNAKKVGFLRKALSVLDMRDVELLHGEFPIVLPKGLVPTLVTARAVERASVISKALARWMQVGAVFLCQSGEVECFMGPMFHVEHLLDEWTTGGMRRGELRLIHRVE
ncbi:MAG: class I SAM-dependent methyltransferase [Candidatus Hydrogenedentes bacterium]|nr:class I SAM-dependent methyltransferase [Candidatus Hydrogenedentota bacterium]